MAVFVFLFEMAVCVFFEFQKISKNRASHTYANHETLEHPLSTFKLIYVACSAMMHLDAIVHSYIYDIYFAVKNQQGAFFPSSHLTINKQVNLYSNLTSVC